MLNLHHVLSIDIPDITSYVSDLLDFDHQFCCSVANMLYRYECQNLSQETPHDTWSFPISTLIIDTAHAAKPTPGNPHAYHTITTLLTEMLTQEDHQEFAQKITTLTTNHQFDRIQRCLVDSAIEHLSNIRSLADPSITHRALQFHHELEAKADTESLALQVEKMVTAPQEHHQTWTDYSYLIASEVFFGMSIGTLPSSFLDPSYENLLESHWIWLSRLVPIILNGHMLARQGADLDNLSWCIPASFIGLSNRSCHTAGLIDRAISYLTEKVKSLIMDIQIDCGGNNFSRFLLQRFGYGDPSVTTPHRVSLLRIYRANQVCTFEQVHKLFN